MFWFAGRKVKDAQRLLAEGESGGNVTAAASLLLEALGIAPGEGAPLRLGPALAWRVVEERLNVPLARRAFLFERASLIRRLGLSAASLRCEDDRLSAAIFGPADTFRLPLNCILIARSILYLAVDLLPKVQHLDVTLFAPVPPAKQPVCFFSASASRARLRVLNPAMLAPAQMAKVMDARAAQVSDEGILPAEPHVPWPGE